MRTNITTVTVITKAANDDNYNTDVKEVKKEQKTPVQQLVRLVVDNKWRILLWTYRVISKWDTVQEKASWLFEIFKQFF